MTTILTRETLEKLYHDWINNYLTIEKFAEHHGLYPEEAKALIKLCREIATTKHPEQ